jgi:transposase-like protein
MNVGGQAIDAAVAEAFLAAMAPAALDACLAAARQLEDGHHTALAQWRRQAEQARYHATRAERRYRAVDPDNRLVARGLEAEWEQALRAQVDAETELARREAARPKALSPQERTAILALGDDLGAVWDAPTTTDKDRKQLLRTLLDEVNITLRRDDPDPHAALVLRWKGGAISELTVPLRRRQPAIRTDEDTISLIRRLAAHYPDAQIAGILNRQHRTTARGLSFTANRVASLRTHWHIPCHQPSSELPEGDLLNVTQAARELGIAPSTLLRWLDDGFVAGEQITPGAPWQIRLTAQLRAMLTSNTPEGWVPLAYATQALGVSRQTVLQKVKRGELRAVLTRTGRRKGLRIELPARQDGLF